MRKILCASALVLLLSGSALAGDIHNPPLVAPPDINFPSSAPQTPGEQPADGIIHDVYSDGIAAAALSVLDSVLALL